MLITPATELDAINNILGAIGESPVNTLEDVTNVDVINAQRILTNINRQQQARGWSFNIIDDYTLNPDDNTHRIRWSDSYLYLRGANGEKYAKSGDYLKDVTNNTTTFYSPIKVTIILLVPFEEMPEAMREYITAKAALAFQTRYLADSTLTQMLSADVKEAWAHLQEYEMDVNEYGMLDNTAVQQLLMR